VLEYGGLHCAVTYSSVNFCAFLFNRVLTWGVWTRYFSPYSVFEHCSFSTCRNWLWYGNRTQLTSETESICNTIGLYSMKKSDLVAQQLVSSKTILRSDDAAARIRRVFLEEFPNSDFGAWNSEIDELRAKQLAGSIGKASMVSVKRMIELLW
jgi:hypothetical protein